MKKMVQCWLRLAIWGLWMALCVRARVADGFAPFASAAYAVLRLSGIHPLALLGGSALGCAASGLGWMGYQALVGCAVVELLYRFSLLQRLDRPVLAGVLAFLGTGLPGVLFSYGIAYNLLGSGLSAMVSMAVAPVLLPLCGRMQEKRIFSREEQFAVALAAVIVAIGLRDTPLQGAYMTLCVLAASAAGAGAGALSGVLMGAALAFSGGQPEAAAVMGMSGALCGVLVDAPQWVRALAFLAVCQTAYLGPFGYSLPAAPFPQALCGALASLALPCGRIRELLAAGEARREVCAIARAEKQLRDAAAVLGEMAQAQRVESEEGGVQAVRQTFRALQGALQGVANGLHGGQIFWTRKPVRLNATVGVSVRAKEAVCGDSYAVVPLPDDRMVAVICDGMGTGEAAHAQSERAVRLITRWMQAGADAPSAIGAANAFFLWQGSETFSTLDLAVIDLRASRAELYKLAAPPSLHLHADAVTEIAGADLPIGVLEGARPTPVSVALRRGDTLFMASDGVMDRYTAQELSAVLRTQVNARKACEAVVRAQRTPKDDMTAIVVKLT